MYSFIEYLCLGFMTLIIVAFGIGGAFEYCIRSILKENEKGQC